MNPFPRRVLALMAYAFLIASFLILNSSFAYADTLTIEIQASLKVQENFLEGAITVANHGDEPARKVYAEFTVPGETVVKEVVDLLEVRQSASFSFKKSLGQTKPGTYAVPITIIFHDAKLYPFSALACPTFSLGETSSSGLSCSTTVQNRGGQIGFEIRNLESSSRKIKSLFLFPREFYCPHPEIFFDLAPLERKTISYSLLRATAIPGARYPVFALLEFQSEKGHHGLVCQGEIRFMEGGNWFKRTRWYWLAGWFFLTVLTLRRRSGSTLSMLGAPILRSPAKDGTESGGAQSSRRVDSGNSG